MPLDPCTDLRRRLAQLRLLVGVEAFLGAGGALSPVQALEAAPQACVPERPVAAAVAGQLVQHAAHARRVTINVRLPGIAEAVACELRSMEDRRKHADL